MRKLKLETDELRVETFDPAPLTLRDGGTVLGHSDDRTTTEEPDTGERCEVVFLPETDWKTCRSCGITCLTCNITCEPCA